MLEVLVSYLILFGLKNNLICTGSGAVLFQREKMYTSFRFISNLFLVLGIVLTSFASYLLNQYVYALLSIEYMAVTINVLFVGLYNLIVAKIWSKLSSFKNYLYKSSFSYVMDFAYMFSVLIMLDTSLNIINFSMMMLAIVVVVFVTNVIMGFFVEFYNRSYVNSRLRHVPSRLFMMAIFSIILYYASLMF